MTNYTIVDDPSAIKRILDSLNVATQSELKNHVGEAGNHCVQVGAAYAHVITGHMRRNIQVQTKGENEVNVVAKARYSGWENKRGGDHAFFDQAVDDTKRTYSGKVLMDDILHVHRSKKI